MNDLDIIKLGKITETCPWWPYSYDGTLRLIRLGRLGCIRVGRNVYVNAALLRAFVASHTVQS